MLNKVSIIVPVYNAEKYLEKCLESLLNQTYKNIEIICVNDGSIDKSLELLNLYNKNDNRIVIYTQNNQGQSVARNMGLEKATGDYIMFVDSDDWVDRTIVEIMLEEALKNNADIVMCAYIREYEYKSLRTNVFETDKIVYENNDVHSKILRRLFGPVGRELSRPEKVDAPISPCMQLFKKDIAISARFNDIKQTGSFEDGLYQIDLYNKCKKFIYINQHLYHYRKTNQFSTTTVYKSDMFEKWNRLYDILNQKIIDVNGNYEFIEALNNRIALCFITLCLNEVLSKDSLFKISVRLRKYLKNEYYIKSFKQLKIKNMPFIWKVFFLCSKYKFTFLVTIMAEAMNKLRGKY